MSSCKSCLRLKAVRQALMVSKACRGDAEGAFVYPRARVRGGCLPVRRTSTLHANLPWAAMMSAMVSQTLLRTPWVLQDCQKPLCTIGRVPVHFRPRLGGWSVRHVCVAGLHQQPSQVIVSRGFHGSKHAAGRHASIYLCMISRNIESVYHSTSQINISRSRKADKACL